MADVNPFGKSVAEARINAGFSQSELARLAGLSRQTLNQIESHGVSPRIDNAVALARALGLTVESLLPACNDIAGIPVHLLDSPPYPGDPLDLVRLDNRWIAVASNHPLRCGTGLRRGDALLASKDGPPMANPIRPRHQLEQNILLGGCDPALGLLADAVNEHTRIGRCYWLPSGNKLALDRFSSGLVHAAAVHRNENEPVGDKFGKRSLALRFSRWQEGWMANTRVATSNPSDCLGRRDYRLVNREAGSGCRSRVDSLLELSGVSKESVAGYESVTYSHADCARTIASGFGDFGLGLESMARAYGLNFVPVKDVVCDLFVRADLVHQPLVGILLDVLASGEFRNLVGGLPGYSADQTGLEVSVK